MAAPTCATCLSQDRWLEPLESFLPQILSTVFLSLELKTEISVCWECKKVVLRAAQFLQQSIHAQTLLNLHQENGSKQYLPRLKSFTRLSVQPVMTINTEDNYEYRTEIVVMKEDLTDVKPTLDELNQDSSGNDHNKCMTATRNDGNDNHSSCISPSEMIIDNEEKPSLHELNMEILKQKLLRDYTETNYKNPYVKLSALNYRSTFVTIVDGKTVNPDYFNVNKRKSADRKLSTSCSTNTFRNLVEQLENDLISKDPVENLKIDNVCSLNIATNDQQSMTMGAEDTSFRKSTTPIAEQSLDIEDSLPMTEIVTEFNDQLSIVETIPQTKKNIETENMKIYDKIETKVNVADSETYFKSFTDYVVQKHPKLKANKHIPGKIITNPNNLKSHHDIGPVVDSKNIPPAEIFTTSGKDNKNIAQAEYKRKKLSSEVEVFRQRRKNSLQKDYVQSLYKCKTCLKGWMEYESLTEHNSVFHWGGDYQCPICKVSYGAMKTMVEHYDQHYNLYECNKCEYAHHEQSELTEHVKRNHEYPSCYECGTPFINEQALERHMNETHCITTNTEKESQHEKITNAEKESQHWKITNAEQESQRGKRTNAEKVIRHEWKSVEKERCTLCFRNSRDLPKHMREVHKVSSSVVVVPAKKLRVCVAEEIPQAKAAHQNYIRKVVQEQRHEPPPLVEDDRPIIIPLRDNHSNVSNATPFINSLWDTLLVTPLDPKDGEPEIISLDDIDNGELNKVTLVENEDHNVTPLPQEKRPNPKPLLEERQPYSSHLAEENPSNMIPLVSLVDKHPGQSDSADKPRQTKPNDLDWTKFVRARVIEIDEDKQPLHAPIKSHPVKTAESAPNPGSSRAKPARPTGRPQPKPPTAARPSKRPLSNIMCPFCQEGFKDRTALGAHTREVHMENCRHCGKLVMTTEMTLHVRSKHPGLMGFHKSQAVKHHR